MSVSKLTTVPFEINFGQKQKVGYVNYRGEYAIREIIPHHLRFGRSTHHPKLQWLLECFDVEKNALRTYALEDMTYAPATEQVKPTQAPVTQEDTDQRGNEEANRKEATETKSGGVQSPPGPVPYNPSPSPSGVPSVRGHGSEQQGSTVLALHGS